MKKPKIHLQEKDIERILTVAKKQALPTRKLKKQCKRGILFAIEQNYRPTSIREIERVIRTCGRLTKPTREQYWRVRERLREAMEKPCPGFLRRTIFNLRVLKGMTAGAITMSIVALSLHFTFTSAPHISAGNISINIIYGGVAVDGKNGLVKGYDGQAVGEGDTLITGKWENALVELQVYDHSVIRLGDNTSVTVEKVIDSKEITLSLQGRIWVKTFDGTSHLKIKASEATTITIPRGAVTILSNDRVTRVLTKENVALVEVMNSEDGSIKAQKVQVPEKHIVNIPKALEKNPEKSIESQKMGDVTRILGLGGNQWVEENEKHDKVFKENLENQKKEEVKKMAGPLPGSPLYTAKKIKEEAGLSILSENQKPFAKLEQAATRFNEALVLFENGKNEEAMKVLGEYKGIIQEITEKDFYGSEAQKLKSAFSGHLATAKNKLASITPETSSYNAKELIESLIIQNAHEGDKVDKKDTIAQNRLYEIRDLIREGKEDIALIYFNEYADMTRESMELARKLMRQGDDSAVRNISMEKASIEVPLLDLIIKESGLLAEKASQLKQETVKSIKEISQALSQEMAPKATLTGVAYRQEGIEKQGESISRDENPDQLPAFRISGVAKK